MHACKHKPFLKQLHVKHSTSATSDLPVAHKLPHPTHNCTATTLLATVMPVPLTVLPPCTACTAHLGGQCDGTRHVSDVHLGVIAGISILLTAPLPALLSGR